MLHRLPPAKAGIKALLLERGRLGARASAAASGVLSAAPGSHPYSRLGRESLALFHSQAGELKDEGGVDIELVQCGELILALSEGDALELRGMAERFSALGSEAQWLDQKAVAFRPGRFKSA